LKLKLAAVTAALIQRADSVKLIGLFAMDVAVACL